MFSYVIRRVIYMPFILLGVVFITFVLFQMTTSPESQAKLHIGEKASQRQVYDWLANKGLIAWTEAGEAKLQKVSDRELDPKHIEFFSASRIEDLPNELEDAKADLEDAQQDTAIYEERYGADSEQQTLLDARARQAGVKNELTKLQQEADKFLSAAREQYVVEQVGLETFRTAQNLRAQAETIESLKGIIEEAKKKNEDVAEREKKLQEAEKALETDKAANGSALTSVETAEQEALKTIRDVGDIEPDFTYRGFFSKFAIYLTELLTLNFGDTRNKRPVMDVIYDGMWPSLALTIPAFLLSELIGVFFGLFAAMYRQTRIDHTIVISSILLMSVNGIALIMFGQKFLASDLNYFPITGYQEGFGALRFLALPILLYVVIVFGEHVRFNRIVMLDETNQDYVRTARAKGVGENGVLFKHIFRNTLIPLITRWAVAIPTLYLGSLVLESFFSIPGLGYLTVDAIQNSDANVIRAIVVFGAISFMFANLLSDVLYAVADPRVKLN